MGVLVARVGAVRDTAPAPARVLVCHENRLVAAGLAREAERELDVLVETAWDAETCLRKAAAHLPDVVVCSDGLSTRMDVVGMANRLRRSGLTARLLVVARVDSTRSFDAALEAGATGYLPLTVGERLPEAIAALLDGRSALHRDSGPRVDAPLTRREHEVLLSSDRGMSDKQIALELGIAVSTVKTHTRSLYGKLGASSRTDALHRARTIGLI